MRTAIMLAVLSVQLAGCSLLQDRRDTAWDPRGSRQLADQIPNWDGAANRICCGHLAQCKPYQSPRC